MKSTRIVLMLIAMLILPGPLSAGDITEQYYDLREKEIRQFTFDLFTAREYYRAITEAKRYSSLFPRREYAGEIVKLIGDAYLMSHEWAEAISAYDDFLIRFPVSPQTNTVIFFKAICLIKQGITAEAERLFQLILSSADPDKKGDAARWMILLLIRQNRYEEVEKRLWEQMVQKEIGGETNLIEDILQGKKKVRYKSPQTAGLLSAILPGCGQFYNERYMDGVQSFLLNALFIFGTYKAFDSDNYGLGGALALFEVGWYTGGIYGAVGGAHKYNRKIDEDHFRNGLTKLNLRENELARPGGVSVIFSYPF